MSVNRTEPMTVISPIRPGWTPYARLVLELLPRTPWGTGSELQELRFIQSARWALLTGLPDGYGGTVATRYDYLLFESNFNGTTPSYLQAFADVLPRRMRAIWNSSFGFPDLPGSPPRPTYRKLRDPIPGRAFVRYVDSASLRADHFHSAYPDASNTEVLAGLEASRQLARLRAYAAAGDPSSFRTAFADALHRLQQVPECAPQPPDARADVRGRKYAFTHLAPVLPGEEDRLRRALAGFATASPFAAVPGLHFGRWVLIDAVRTQPGQHRDGWPSAYLLTTSTLDRIDDATDGEPERRTLAEALDPQVCELVWGACVGYPAGHDPEDLSDYLRAGQVRTSRFYTGYPYASLADVLAGLVAHRRLLVLAATGGQGPAETLLAKFRSEFAGGT